MAAAVIRIPKIGVSMIEAVLAEWLADDGTQVEAGKALYLLEMDKATNEIMAPISGRLQIVGEVGQTYLVGDLIARIHTD
jgi:pyruvate/2-oxoglutarate dehydrogenase complex dihydrolipoamide acyltransferase (E2) component